MNRLDEKQLGKRLQDARQQAGLTQQALCQKAGLSYSTLAKIERGAIRTPSIFTIQSIAGALGTSLDALVGVPAPPARERARSRSGVRFIYFDVNGCLVRFYLQAFTKISAIYDVPADVVETAFWHYNSQVCRGGMTMEAFNQAMARHLHAPDFDWATYYLEAVQPIPHTADLLQWTAEHYGIGLLTNIMPGLIQQMRARRLIPDIAYDTIIDSSEVHLLKPERAIYELAQARSGHPAEEILFIDDFQSNLMAAEKLGWHVMRFDDSRPEETADRIREALALA